MLKKIIILGFIYFPIVAQTQIIKLPYHIINTDIESNFDLNQNNINKCNSINQCIKNFPIPFQKKLMYLNTFDCDGSNKDYKIDIKVVYKTSSLCSYADIGWPLGDFVNIYHHHNKLENLLLINPLNAIKLSDLNHSNQLPHDMTTNLITNTKIATQFQGYPIGVLYETSANDLLFLTKIDNKHLMYFILPQDIYFKMSTNPNISIKLGKYYLVNLSDKKDDLQRYFKYADNTEYSYMDWNNQCKAFSVENYVSDFFNNKDLTHEVLCLKLPHTNKTMGYNADYPYFEPIDMILYKKIGDK